MELNTQLFAYTVKLLRHQNFFQNECILQFFKSFYETNSASTKNKNIIILINKH